jgi:hypothetical protein
MTATFLTPTLALAYLRELSLDVRAAVVLDAVGERLAGDAELVERARAALADAGLSGAGSVAAADGTLLVARAASGRAIAVLAGPQALGPLLAHDLAAVVAELVET